MQSKGWIRLVAILLAIASIWQLSFTAVTRIQENKAAKYAEEQALQFVESNNVAAEVREYVQDSVANIRNRAYIDSISTEKVFFGYTYKSVKEKEINLGLDLKGGMNVMLQVQLEDLVKALSGNSSDPDFVAAMAQAKANNTASSADFIGLFEEAWNQIAPQRRLAEIFATYELRDKIANDATNAQVITVIRSEAKSAVDNSFNVLRNRIDRFGVTQPNIQQVGNSGKILIELPGVKDPERVRKLLQGTASLEFWPTYQGNEVDLYAVDARVSEILGNLGDSTAVANPLFQVLSPSGWNNACIGFAQGVDTVKVNQYLAMASDVLPAGFKGMWSVKPTDLVKGSNLYELVAIKVNSRDGKAPLDGGVVTDARVNFNGAQNGGNGAPSVSMTMNAEGASIWARLTKDNIGKQVAIVLDGLVYSYPTVNTEITGGSSEITGNFDVQEAEDLANVLKSGKLPAPATIIQEQVVGPSLGSAILLPGRRSHCRCCPAVQRAAAVRCTGKLWRRSYPARYRRSGVNLGYGRGCQRDYLRAHQGRTGCRQGLLPGRTRRLQERLQRHHRRSAHHPHHRYHPLHLRFRSCAGLCYHPDYRYHHFRPHFHLYYAHHL